MSRCENDKVPNEKFNNEVRRTPSFSGPLMLPNRASANSLSAPIKSSGGKQVVSILQSSLSLVLQCLVAQKAYCTGSSPLIGFRDSLDDKSKTNLVQIKGRFSVTSENLDLVKVSLLFL